MFGAANIIKGLENCVNSTIEYCKQRETFGQPLINNQVIHFRMGELQTEIEALRALTYSAVEQYINKKDVTKVSIYGEVKSGSFRP